MGVLQIRPHCLGLNVPLLAKCPPVGYSESEVSEMDGRQMGHCSPNCGENGA